MSPTKPRRVLGYCRVSSAEQALGTSLSDQEEVIRRYAKERGYRDPTLYVEAASAIREKIEHRDKIRSLMADVRAGDLVLVDKIDRWSRDPEFTYASVRTILDMGAHVYFIGDACDPSTNEGDSTLGFRILFAREEHKRIKQRTVGTRNLLRAKGYYAAGMVPFGYRRQVEPKDRLARNVLEVVPEEAETVRTIFRRYVAGESMARLGQAYNMSTMRIHSMLHCRTYLGEVQTPPSRSGKKDGDWIKGQHEPIVERDLFDRAQVIIVERIAGGPRPREAKSETSDWILKDVARCGHCRAKMRSAFSGPKDHRRRHYYICPKKCRPTCGYISVPLVEGKAAEIVSGMLKVMRSELSGPSEKPTKPKEDDIESKREALKRKRDRVVEAYEDGAFDRETFRNKLAKLDTDLAELERVIKPSPLESPKVRRGMLGQLSGLERALGALHGEEMRAIVNVLVSAVLLVSREEPKYVWKSLEDIRVHFELVRETLTSSLGRAPTVKEEIEALYGEMSEA